MKNIILKVQQCYEGTLQCSLWFVLKKFWFIKYGSKNALTVSIKNIHCMSVRTYSFFTRWYDMQTIVIYLDNY